MFKSIVIGVDGSEASMKAVKVACDLAGKYGSAVHLVHTPQPQTVAFALGAMAGYHAVTTMPSQEEIDQAAKKVLNEAAAAASEASVEVAGHHSEAGDPARNIVDYAERIGADLIVTGRRGLGDMGALVLGSTTQHVNHAAKCATLSVA